VLDTDNYSIDICLVKAESFDNAYEILWQNILKDDGLLEFIKLVNKAGGIKDFHLKSHNERYREYINKDYMMIVITLIDTDEEYTYLGGFSE